MVSHTPILGAPYVDPADTVSSYPTTSQELALGLDNAKFGTVPRFATAAARSAAIAAPVDGMISYQLDRKRLEIWTASASAWVPQSGCWAYATVSVAGMAAGSWALATCAGLGQAANCSDFLLSGGGIQCVSAGTYQVMFGAMSVSGTASTELALGARVNVGGITAIADVVLGTANLTKVASGGVYLMVVPANGVVYWQAKSAVAGASVTGDVQLVRIGA